MRNGLWGLYEVILVGGIPQLFFNEMSNCVQGSSESELDFCLRAMSLRQKDLRLWLLLQFR